MNRTVLTIVLAAGLGASTAIAPLAQAAPPAKYANCTNYNKSYPHGVGRKGARDKTSGRPVTTFRVDTAEYDRAMKYRRDLDRDRDGIACEKR